MTPQVDAIVQDEIVGDADIVKKKVDELSLDEIKNELEKRSLDASGDDYAILHERLTDHMIEEGLDPATFEFELEADEDEEDEEEEQQQTKQQATTSSSNGNGKAAQVAESPEKKVKAPEKTAEKSSGAKDNKEIAGNHIWVSGLSSRCKAAELKKFFTKIATVGSAKIVANARTSSANCYGYITVESPEDLKKCVEKLHGTKFEGNFIKVEACKLAPADQLRKVEMEYRKRQAQQKEEFGKRRAQRRDRIEAERKKKIVQRVQELEKKKEVNKKRSEQKPKDVKKESKTGPSRPRSKSPIRKDAPTKVPPLPRNQASKGRRSERGPGRGPRRRSPRRRARGRGRSQSPFRQNAPIPPFFQGNPPGGPIMDRFLPMDNPRFLDRRMDEERMEIERRQQAEAEALERERKQLRLEKERLEREKLDLIRLERERVKKEMEEITMRKKMAESRRHEEINRHDDDRKPQMELDRRGMRDDVRLGLASGQEQGMSAYDTRASLPVDDYGRMSVESKFSGRLGPPAQREALPRMDDRRRDERRREVSAPQRDERRHVETFDPWTAANTDMKSRSHYSNQQHADLASARKRGRSRSPPSARSNVNYGVGQTQQSYNSNRSNNNADLWGSQISSTSAVYNDQRRPLGQTRGLEQQNGSGWQPNSRVAFPPAFSDQGPSIRGFVGGHNGGSTSNGFGLPTIAPSYRRY